MKLVYSATPGHRVRVGNLGECSDTEPVVVSDELAAEIAGPELRVADAPPKAAPKSKDKPAAPAKE